MGEEVIIAGPDDVETINPVAPQAWIDNVTITQL